MDWRKGEKKNRWEGYPFSGGGVEFDPNLVLGRFYGPTLGAYEPTRLLRYQYEGLHGGRGGLFHHYGQGTLVPGPYLGMVVLGVGEVILIRSFVARDLIRFETKNYQMGGTAKRLSA